MLVRDPVFLPSVSQTAQLRPLLHPPVPFPGKPLWYDALTSLRRVLIGFTAGTVIEVLKPLPPLAFIPLFIIWLGIGEMPKEVLIMIGILTVGRRGELVPRGRRPVSLRTMRASPEPGGMADRHAVWSCRPCRARASLPSPR